MKGTTIISILIGILIIWGVISLAIAMTKNKVENRIECESLDNCLQYKCKAKNSQIYNQQRNLLLEYNNCLLEEIQINTQRGKKENGNV